MEPEYLNLISLFNEEKVEYVVLGGHAVIAHGFVRTTGDIDIFVNSTSENAQRLLRALHRFGYTNDEFEESDFTKVPNYLCFSRYDNRIDLMTGTKGVTFEECYANRKVLQIRNTSVNFIGLRQLIENKKAVGRPQDLRDIENLDSSSV
ncbi:DUF6036 family nucleotidyltransferase [Dyadobacter aurulentus]|uniref:DUF6036 family nucleotidyltransferase n=1 Tax=Dyadobacter sp. UC 10 TaxID=2605428 RepID=UPI0011F2839E|nr:DUF6036 family nucleotidyltransferase [Dyadobacter sp. UC 10]KAA0989983.1 nucleotidyltransferase family protein [Dyadobacter sp. UC 10]